MRVTGYKQSLNAHRESLAIIEKFLSNAATGKIHPLGADLKKQYESNARKLKRKIKEMEGN